MRFLLPGVVAGLCAAALFGACSQQAEEPSTPQLNVATSYCATDLSCPAGNECAGGSCAPIPASIRPHIQTALILFRTPLSGEPAWCAHHYDLIIGAVRPDEVRPINPNIRLFDYTLIRYHRFDEGPKTAADWAVAHGWNPEDFYLHYREDVMVPTWEGQVIVPGFPPGMVPGWNPSGVGGKPHSATQRSQSRVVGYDYGNPTPWYFANLGHPGYRQFLFERTAGLIDGTWYYNEPYASGPLDGVLCDEAVYYPSFGEGLLDKTTEYYGIPLTDTHPYAITTENLYPAMSEAMLTLVGTTADIMPNYGHVLFLNYPNHSAIQIQTTTPWILGEVWVTYTGQSTPTSGNSRCISYDKDYVTAVRKIVEQTQVGGRRVLGARDVSNGTTGSDRGKLFTLGLYYLLQNRQTYYEYESADQSADHVSMWAWNTAAEFSVGQPAPIPPGVVDFQGRVNTNQHWEFATGPDPYAPALTYHVLARRYTNALVLVKMLPIGSVIDDRSTTVHPLDRAYRVLSANGTLGVRVTEARIRNNDALILIPEVTTGIN